jgi:hypothetical protein
MRKLIGDLITVTREKKQSAMIAGYGGQRTAHRSLRLSPEAAESGLLSRQAVAGAACLPNRDNRRADLVENFLRVFGAQPLDSAFLDIKQGHKMLPHLFESPRIISATHGLVIFQNALGESGLPEFYIARDGEL